MFAPDRLRKQLLWGTRPQDPATSAAAVSVILGQNTDAGSRTGPDVLFIERATHDGDPWSGHMAFPGGRVDPGDAGSTYAAAKRETAEEIGVDLSDAMRLGRLPDQQGGPQGTQMRLSVTPHVFAWQGERPALQPNHEVADCVWVSVADLFNSDNAIRYRHPKYPGQSWPGIELHDGRVVWGLTLRMLNDLLDRVKQPVLADV